MPLPFSTRPSHKLSALEQLKLKHPRKSQFICVFPRSVPRSTQRIAEMPQVSAEHNAAWVVHTPTIHHDTAHLFPAHSAAARVPPASRSHARAVRLQEASKRRYEMMQEGCQPCSKLQTLIAVRSAVYCKTLVAFPASVYRALCFGRTSTIRKRGGPLSSGSSREEGSTTKGRAGG